MTTFSISTCFTLLVFLTFHFNSLNSLPISSFSFEKFDKDPVFDSDIALFGDAKLVSNGSKLQLTNSVGSSAGRVIYKKPFKFLEGNPAKLVSFSSYVSFLMSPDKGDGLAFIMVPSGLNVSEFGNSSFGFGLESEKKSDLRFVAVEFDTSRDEKYGDLSDNHVGIDVSGFVSVKAKNATSINSVLNNGKKLHAWIDYIAASKRLEVRLSQFGDMKPMDPMLSHPIDLSKMWNREEVLIGLGSANRNSSQTCFIYSWSFKQWSFPHWMHSQPLDPQAFTKDAKPVIAAHKKTDCLSKVLAAMIFGSACGALGAFIVLYLWTIFGNRRPVAPEECSSVHPVVFDYKKVKVVVDKTVEDGKQVAV